MVLLVPSATTAQSLYWAAPVNDAGNRDGTWSTSAVSWASAPGGAATSTWPGGGAVFSAPENGAVTLVGSVTSTGITAGDGGSYTLAGNGTLVLVGINASLHVGTSGAGVLTLDCNTLAQNTFSLVKNGAGTLRVNGWITAPTFSLREGTTILSRSSFSRNLENSANLVLNGNNTVSSYVQSSGALLGSSTLKVSGATTLQGGTIAGNLSGNIISSSGLVDVTGFIGGQTLSVGGGTFTLAGRSGMQVIKVGSAGTFIDLNANLSESKPIVENQGIFRLGKDTSITKIVQSGGDLGGPGVLSVQSAYFTGGSISGSISGDIGISGNVMVSGTMAGGALTVYSGGIARLEGTSSNASVNIFGELRSVNGGLDSESNVNNSGVLFIDSDETVKTYVQEGTLLAGTGTLTVTNGLLIKGGTIRANTWGDITIEGGRQLVNLDGRMGGNILNVASGTVSLGGISDHTEVNVAAGASVNVTNMATAGLSKTAVVRNSGGFGIWNHEITVSTYWQGDGAALNGFSTTLTATDGATLEGGRVRGGLAGDTNITGDVLVDVTGRIGGGVLSIQSGNLTLSGISTNAQVDIFDGAGLFSDGSGLDSGSVITNSGELAIGSEHSVSRYIQNSTGSFVSNGFSLTASDGITLNGGTVAGVLLGSVESIGTVNVTGTIGQGSLMVKGGELSLSGISDHSIVNIAAGAVLKNSGNLRDTSHLSNSGTLIMSADDIIGTFTLERDSLLAGSGMLTADGGATLKGGTVAGVLSANAVSNGNVLVSGSMGGGSLAIANGTLTLTGTSTNSVVDISQGASLKDTGDLGDSATIINHGAFSLDSNDTVGLLMNNYGTVDGTGRLLVAGSTIFNGGELKGNLSALGGATLSDGTTISGKLDGFTTIGGDVLISGSQSGGLLVDSGTLDLTGTLGSDTRVSSGASLCGTGRIKGDLTNSGTLALSTVGDRTLDIGGDLKTNGVVALTLNDASDFDQIKVGGKASLGGALVVSNVGTGLASGETATVIEADAYSGAFDSFTAAGFDNGVLFDDTTGRLIGMAGGTTGSSTKYLNLNPSQTRIYFSLYEDSVEIGKQNVTEHVSIGGPGGIRSALRTGGNVTEEITIEFTSGLSDGDAQLVDALNLATFTDPGSIYQPVINRLSPEVHRGMADHTEQATRSHVREAVDAAPVSRVGKTQVFATAHSSVEGVDSGGTEAGYDLQMTGFTSGARHELDKLTRIGGLFGWDDGTIQGALIDTEGHGFVLGAFASRVLDEKRATTLTASLACGGYDFNSTRHSFQGDVSADDIGSDALEFALGARTTVYQKGGLLVSPNVAMRFIDGSVDGFVEHGAGVPLRVGGQDIESAMLDLGVDVEYKPIDDVTLAGNIGYVNDFGDSGEAIHATFAASGTNGRPFSASAPGIDDEAIVLGLGAYYDLNERVRVSMTYRGDIRIDSQDAHNFGVGMSIGF